MKSEKSLVIIGCGRAGTLRTASIIGKHFNFKHEKIGINGGIGWNLLSPIYVNKTISFDNIWHQIRNPLKNIGSMCTHNRWIFDTIGKILNIKFENNVLHNSMLLWYEYNRFCESKAKLTYKVEDMIPNSPISAEFDNFWNYKLDYSLTTNYHTRTSFGTYKTLTYKDLYNVDKLLAEKIIEYAKTHGYKI